MLKITVEDRQLRKNMRQLSERDVRWAAKFALDDTAADVLSHVQDRMGEVFDRPTRFIAPVGRSRSLITGASFVSAAQRRRRAARLDISSLSLDRNGAGYMEVLKRLLDGGVHLVRLHSTPINWHLDDTSENATRTHPMSWIVPSAQIDWTVPTSPFNWWTGPDVTMGEALSGNQVRVTGLPPNSNVVRPGEFVTMSENTAMVLRPARSNGSGVAILHLVTPLSGSGTILIGTREVGVFEADAMPRSVQPTGDNWHYSWSFTEVFADERGPFEEINPWS